MTDQKIIELLGIESLPQQGQTDFVQKFKATVQLRLIGLVDDLIDDNQRRELNSLLDDADNSSTDVMQWLQTNIVDLGQLEQSVAQDYAAELKTQINS